MSGHLQVSPHPFSGAESDSWPTKWLLWFLELHINQARNDYFNATYVELPLKFKKCNWFKIKQKEWNLLDQAYFNIVSDAPAFYLFLGPM